MSRQRVVDRIINQGAIQMAKRKSVFIRSKQDMATVTIKVPKQLKDRADCLSNELKAIDQSLAFNMPLILQEAYQQAVQTAEEEINKMKSKTAGGTNRPGLSSSQTG